MACPLNVYTDANEGGIDNDNKSMVDRFIPDDGTADGRCEVTDWRTLQGIGIGVNTLLEWH